MDVSRRKFFRICTGGMAGTITAALGFAPKMALAQARNFKLLRAKGARGTCAYRFVGCGPLVYSLGDGAKNVKEAIYHIEGDPDHPVSRGTLCPRGAGLLNYVYSENHLRYPQYHAPGSDKWQRISWDEAFNHIARLIKANRDASFIGKNGQGVTVNCWLSIGMLCASAISNETGMLAQKFMCSFGMLAVDNQVRVRHGPTVASLAPTFGRGTMASHWVDIKNVNIVVVMGSNAVEAHPVGFHWAMEAESSNDATLIVVDLRFTRTAPVADIYAPVRPGTDVIFLPGVLLYLIESNKIDAEYVKHCTNVSLLVWGDFVFKEDLFSGYDAEKRQYDKLSWNYQLDENSYVRRGKTLSHPRCVWNLLRQHVSRYTPEAMENTHGTPKADFLKVYEVLASINVVDRTTAFLHALGWAQHTVGTQNIRATVMTQLLLGNMDTAGGGIGTLRGHSNIQGLTGLGLLSTNLPGYLTLPSDKQSDLQSYLSANISKATLPGQVNHWNNHLTFFISLAKLFYDEAAQERNDWDFNWLPKRDQAYDAIKYFNMVDDGNTTSYICQGFNLVASFPDKNKMVHSPSKLKYLMVTDPLVTETLTLWQSYGKSNNVDPAAIQTEAFRLSSTCFVEEDGSVANPDRRLQWHWKGQDAPGEVRNDDEILTGIYYHLRRLYRRGGGKGAEPLLKMSQNYKQPNHPGLAEVAKENNGYALADLYDQNGTLLAKEGQLLNNFALLRDGGNTASSCWVYTDGWTGQGSQMVSRDNTDPSGLGNILGWVWVWPLNRRVLYNRASADIDGKPWDAKRTLIRWNDNKWIGNDILDFNTAPPGNSTGPFIMQQEGLGHLFALDELAEGPFPEHYESMETPPDTNPLHPKMVSNLMARLYEEDAIRLGRKDEFPCVGATYRLTEHFHIWTRHALLNSIAQPEQFVGVSEGLAKGKDVASSDWVEVSSKRGFIRAAAVVTRRLRTLNVSGQQVETVGIPLYWDFEDMARKGYTASTLAPSVGDSNSQASEYKAFLANIEKVQGAVQWQ